MFSRLLRSIKSLYNELAKQKILNYRLKKYLFQKNENKVVYKFNKKSAAISGSIMGTILIGYLWARKEKELKKLKKRYDIAKESLGGSVNLIDTNGQEFSIDRMLGKWHLIYFGFTHCPDVCPEELEKIGKVIDILDKDTELLQILPIFISVDPARDTPDAIKKYLKDFNSKFVGLTGDKEAISKATKLFRVYYEAHEADEFDEYIVDHTIITYLVNPEGEFVDYFMRSNTVEQMVDTIKKHVKNFQVLKNKKWFF